MRIFKKIAIGFVFIMFFLMGMNTADLIPNAITKENTIYVDTKYGINITRMNKTDEEIIEKYLDNLDVIPNDLRKYCEEIVFTNEDLGQKFELDITNPILALSYGDTIYINTEKYEENVLIHEMYHVYDYKHKWISEQEEFINLYEDYKENISVSPGNVNNCYEFFASCGEMYFLNPDEIMEVAPSIYEYFESLNIN